jgi:hypothetical protein
MALVYLCSRMLRPLAPRLVGAWLCPLPRTGIGDR